MRIKIREVREIIEVKEREENKKSSQGGFSEEALRLYKELMGYDEKEE